ncbi:MAG TPA: HAD family hydrolase [Vicinamibacterales bacterium]|nr:HAD family hydrolase [Vicinamibacterales bacterium]
MSRGTRAVFFDVDFTLIHPGPTFQGSGYHEFCARHGVAVDPTAFERAVVQASAYLDAHPGVYDPEIFVRYTTRIIEAMGGTGPGVERAARDIYDEWAACHHFQLYEEVPEVLRSIRDTGVRIGLISNTQRCLATFAEHFELRGLFDVALSSSEHGYMKPHPSIFEAALAAVGSTTAEAVMVGDSLAHDIAGARSIGMRAVLVARSGPPPSAPGDVAVIESLRELPPLL